MAARTAVANGNWSSPSTWDGGATIPATGDTVNLSTFTVQADQDITVVSISATTGKLVVSAARTINANIPTSGSTGGSFIIEATLTTGTFTLNGNISAAIGTAQGIRINAASTVVVNGNLSGYYGGQPCILVNASGADLTVTGTADVSSMQLMSLVSAVQPCTITYNGAVTGGAVGTNGVFLSLAATCTVTINGNVTGGGGAGNHAIASSGSSTITVNGTVAGGSNATAYGISLTGPSTVTVTGTTTGGSAGAAINTTSAASIVDMQGTCTASTGAPAYVSTGTASIARVTDLVCASNGMWPVGGGRILMHASTNVSFTTRDDSAGAGTGAVVNLTNYPSGIPSAANVRYGTTFGVGLALTGTLRVPSPSSVAAGALTDNTVGTAALTPAQVWDALISSLTTSGSIGERLKNCSTVATTGDQIAGALDA